MTSNDDVRAGAHGLDRRQILKAGAWAAPAIVLAAAVPSAAASLSQQTFTPGTVTIGGDKKNPTITVTGTATGPWTATLIVTDPKSGDVWSDNKAANLPRVKSGVAGNVTGLTFPVYNKHDASDRTYNLSFTVNSQAIPSATRTGEF